MTAAAAAQAFQVTFAVGGINSKAALPKLLTLEVIRRAGAIGHLTAALSLAFCPTLADVKHAQQLKPHKTGDWPGSWPAPALRRP